MKTSEILWYAADRVETGIVDHRRYLAQSVVWSRSIGYGGERPGRTQEEVVNALCAAAMAADAEGE